jgi:hypothetical protein
MIFMGFPWDNSDHVDIPMISSGHHNFFKKNKEAGRLYKKCKAHKSTSMGIMIFVKLYVHPWAL